jgi:hypothetical protein
MTAFRLISPALRGGLLVAAGTALIVAPLFLQLSAAAIVTGMAVGVLVVALGLAGSDGSGRGTLPLAAQAAYDRGVAIGLIAAALVFGLAGQIDALALFAGAGAGALLVTSITRYSARPA